MSPFTFGFASEDIEYEDVENEEDQEMIDQQEVVEQGELGADGVEAVDLVPARRLEVGEMLLTLPSSLAYSTHAIKTTTTVANIPRRTLFDIRAQIMAEDDLDSEDSSTIGLSTEDILPKTYEGGFKTWECSVDLAQYLLRLIEEGNFPLDGKDVAVIELGCGTTLPTSLLLSHILSHPPTPSNYKTTILLADYNSHVLTHTSLPNLLLTYASKHPDLQPFPSDETLSTPPSLLTAFTTALAARNIHIAGLAGAWSLEFVELARSIVFSETESSPRVVSHPHLKIILASETLYSPSSLPSFIATLYELLEPPSNSHYKPSEFQNLVLLATKKVYFGVGGDIDQFLDRWGKDCRGWARVVWDSDDNAGGKGSGGGVGRCILEVGR